MTYFQAHIIHCHGPPDFALRKVKEVHSLQKSGGSWQKNTILILLLDLGIYEKIDTSTFGSTSIPLAPRSIKVKGAQRF